MIDFLKGEIVSKSPTRLILKVGGVGFALQIPLSTFEQISDIGDVEILTYLHIREDAWNLYGFFTPAERDMFTLLLSVAGVGPSTALTALSGSSVLQIREIILSEDIAALSRIKGIGKKTSQRIILELKEAMYRLSCEKTDSIPVIGHGKLEDTILALVSLGYNRNGSRLAVNKAFKILGEKAKTEDLLREALKLI